MHGNRIQPPKDGDDPATVCGIPIDPELAWMAPLVEAAALAELFDPGVVAEIRQWRPEASPGDWDTPEGACFAESAGEETLASAERYRILIARERPLSTFLTAIQHLPVPRAEQLDTLAHELAHTRIRSHGEAHARLTREILSCSPQSWDRLETEGPSKRERKATGLAVREGSTLQSDTWIEATKVQTMLAHETIRDLLSVSLVLMADIVPLLASGKGTADTGDLGVRYDGFLKKLAALREEDPRLADEAWDWIWSGSGEFKTGTAEETTPSPMKLYGRLSFINTEIFHFL